MFTRFLLHITALLFIALSAHTAHAEPLLKHHPEHIDAALTCADPQGENIVHAIPSGSAIDIEFKLIRRDNGQPIQGATVYWANRNEDGIRSVQTNEDGIATIRHTFNETTLIEASFFSSDDDGSSHASCSFTGAVQGSASSGDPLVSLTQSIRDVLGAAHLNPDMWHYYAERLTAPMDSPAYVQSINHLQEVMRYWKGTSPEKPRGDTQAEQMTQQNTAGNLLGTLDQTIEHILGAEHLTPDMRYYYSSRIIVPADHPRHIPSAQNLERTMMYWRSVHPHMPRGLTQAEERLRQSLSSDTFLQHITPTARDVFERPPTPSQWRYWAHRIIRNEIIDVHDLRNKMTYHRNFFRFHGQWP